MKKLLFIISTNPGRQAWFADLLSALNNEGLFIRVWTRSKRFRRNLRREHIVAKKLRLPALHPILFCISLPLLWLIFGVAHTLRIMQKRPAQIILCNWPEKIVLSPFSHFFGVKLFWLEDPTRAEVPKILYISALYRHYAKHATVLVFGSKTQETWAETCKAKSIQSLFPSPYKPVSRQDDLFKTLAETGDRSRFVVGSVLYGLPKDQAERLLSALAIAQSVCPLIELVILGSGKNRQQLQWLSKRMGLERRVWLAGPSEDFQRWVGHLDTYVIAASEPTLDDVAWALHAMLAGLPVLAPQKNWLSDVITTKTGALIDVTDPETIARQLISLQQNEVMRRALGAEAAKTAEQFSFEKLRNSVVKLLS